MDLRQRLDNLVRSGALGTPTPPRASRPLEDLLEGEEISGPRGRFFLCRRDLPRSHRCGPAPLAGVSTLSPRWLPRLGRDLDELDPTRLVFLDTETTGLAGGTGTYAFLVGLAWLEEDCVRVEQLFMRDHSEEGALLEYLARRLEGCGGVVTFNGKTFDLPLLQTRFVMKRLRVDLESLPHLDLLHPARRIWSRGLPDCRLETLEHHVLGLPRVDDVPGSEIPETWFRYLRNGDGRGLVRVAEHNHRDLLALMGLTSWLARALEAPLEERRPEEDAGLGRMMAHLGDAPTSQALLARALEGQLPAGSRVPTLLHLARLRRRSGDRPGAARLWQQVLEGDPAHPEAGEELARHLEHRERDYRGALDLVERILARRDLPASRRHGLEHRRGRLLRRLETSEPRNPPEPPSRRTP